MHFTPKKKDLLDKLHIILGILKTINSSPEPRLLLHLLGHFGRLPPLSLCTVGYFAAKNLDIHGGK